MLILGVGLLLVHVGYTNPTGPPSSTCQSMTPNVYTHGSGATTAVEYTIEFPNGETTYTPGVPLTGIYTIEQSSHLFQPTLINNYTHVHYKARKISQPFQAILINLYACT